MGYIRTLKRIRNGKTNYRKRASLLIGRHSFVSINVSDQNVSAQLIKPTLNGDLVVASSHSIDLRKFGWKGSLNNLPACYLTGLLLGKRALTKDCNSAVLYIGKKSFTSRIAACLKGVVDSGLKIPVSEESFPDNERLNGTHISNYAKLLKDDQDKYNQRFSQLINNGFDPQNYPGHFDEIRSLLINQQGSNNETPDKTTLTKEVTVDE